MQSVAPARGNAYRRMLTSFATRGELVAQAPRFAVIRRPMLLMNKDTYEETRVYWYGIGCFMCGKISWNPVDVDAHYCPLCKMFHDSI